MLSERWTDPSIVEEFAKREPDHRLRALLDAEVDPSRLRVLDLGCAAGRNTILLAERGCDVHATDLSPAMIEETRRRLASIVGEAEALSRVRQLPMDDLSPYASNDFDLVVALGIYHQAYSLDEWKRAVAETERVLRKGSRLLVAHFAPGTDLSGKHGHPVEGCEALYEVRDGGFAILLSMERLDAMMAAHGLTPVVPTETVTRPREGGGLRVTVNALFRKTN